MYGASIEKDFQHITLENEQSKRTLETRRLLEGDWQHQARPRRSLVEIFGRFLPRLDQRIPAGRSQVTSS
jgi:hypothetical protein